MRRAATLLALAIAGPGCASRDATLSAEAVVRAWAADLSRGDVAAAARRFTLPATIHGPTGDTRLLTGRAVRFFSESLPCGAEVVAIRSAGPLVVALLRLVRRPGAECGAGAGGTVVTAFAVHDGRITRWARVSG